MLFKKFVPGKIKRIIKKMQIGSTPFGYLDSPTDNQVLQGVVNVQGWVLAHTPNQLDIEIRIDKTPVEASIYRISRPDVAAAYPEVEITNPPGFVAAVNTLRYSNGKHLLTCVAQNGSASVVIGQINIEIQNSDTDVFYNRVYTDKDQTRRRKKFKTLLEIIACPVCQSPLTQDPETQLRCVQCGQLFPVINGVPIIVVGEPEYPVEEALLDSPPSDNPYPPQVLAILEQTHTRGGLALDLGSGRRSFGAEHLIQLEICAYPFTDIVNQSETLPFRDESFDFVFSLAVTEHVKRPWILAAEMQRVTKKGGDIIVDSAFLQPIHGYPTHYFNMTHSALRELFKDLQVISLRPAPYQHPWFSLNWILDHLFVDLLSDQKSLIADMTVEKFLKELSKYCQGQPSELRNVHLPEDRLEELAAGFTLHGRKGS